MSISKMTEADIADNTNSLPMLPAIISRLLTLNVESDDAFEDVVKLVNTDPGFAARLLRTANSAKFSMVEPATSIQKAALRIGVAQIVSLATSDAVVKVFTPRNVYERRLWHHSIEVAVAAREIARSAPELGINPDSAYMGGLFHDIGRFVLLSHDCEVFRLDHDLVTDSSLDNSNTPDDVEVYQYNHSEIGYLTCKKWQIPDAVTRVVRNHHNASDNASNLEERIVALIDIADHLSDLIFESDDFDELEETDKIERIRLGCISTKTPPIENIEERLLQLSAQIQTESGHLTATLGV